MFGGKVVMGFVSVLSGFIGSITVAGLFSLLLTLYSIRHINTIRYTLLNYEKKVEYSFKRLVINFVCVIVLAVLLSLTSIIPNNNGVNTIYFIICGVVLLILAIFFIWKFRREMWPLRHPFSKMIREGIIFPIIMAWILLYYSFLSFSYICGIMFLISRVVLVLGIIFFVWMLVYGMFKKSDKEQAISYYYAYEIKENNDGSHCDKIIYIFENFDGVLVCRYKDCLKVTEEKSNELLKELRKCEEHIKTCVMRESDKEEIIEKIDEVRKYNRHGYIELGDKCVKDFVNKIIRYNGTTHSDKSVLEKN